MISFPNVTIESLETDNRKDKIEKNVKHVYDSNKTGHRRSSFDNDRSFNRRTRPVTERSYKYEETKYRREDSTHSRRYELETSSSYHLKSKIRDSKESMQYSGRNKDRGEYSSSRYDIQGPKRGDVDNYPRNNSNYCRRGESGSPKSKRSENERNSRSRRPEQPRYNDEYTTKKTQSRDRSYNYSGINDFTNNDFRSSSNSNLQSVKRSSDSLNEKSVLTETTKSKKRKTVDGEAETDVSRQLKTGAAVSPHRSGQSAMVCNRKADGHLRFLIRHLHAVIVIT